jgi:hypothetical protein
MVSSDRNTGTFKQARRLLEVIDEIAPMTPMLQRILGATNVLQAIAECPDPSRVDMDKVIRLFREPFEPAWVDFETQLRMVRDRAKTRGWALRDHDFTVLVTNELLPPERPEMGENVVQSFDIWLGSGMEYNWAEMTSWLADSLETVGMKLQDSIESATLNMRGPAPDYPDRPRATVLEHSFIDLNQIAVYRDMPMRKLGESRPRFDLLVLFAMNPSLCRLMGEKLPASLAMTGFVDQHSRTMPVIERGDEDTLVIDWLSVQ